MSHYGNFFSIPKLNNTASSTNPISIRSLRNCRLSSLQLKSIPLLLNSIVTSIHFLLEPVKFLLNTLKLSTFFRPFRTTQLASMHAIEIFLRTFPAIPDRTFEGLVGILILHAPTFIPTTSALGYYSNAMAITGTSSAMAAPLDAAGLAQLISKHQKELSAIMNKKNGVPRPRSAPDKKYCYIHGYQKSHTGADCNVLKANAQQQYNTPQHLAATDHHHPAGGNPNVRG
jgi:hypothetical protein